MDVPHRTRREVLARTGLAAGLSAVLARGSLPRAVRAEPTATPSVTDDRPPGAVFPQSVASGDPTPTGVVLWTRIAPDAHEPGAGLFVEIAREDFAGGDVVRRRVPPERIGPTHDFTVKVDLDGELAPGTAYRYRFTYDGVHSQVGRTHTLPAPDATPDSVRLAVLTCQDYQNGYYGAYHHVAEADVDALVHLGDFVYEAVDDRFAGPGSPRFDDRDLTLPSGEPVAQGLEDFRFLHRTYRGDRFLQSALSTHPLIACWDDHEVANNRYWDYERDEPRAPNRGSIAELTADGIQAWWEYTPARVPFDRAGLESDLHDTAQFNLWRRFQFGDLLELVLTDERLYRTPPPCDDGAATGPDTGDHLRRGPLCRDEESPRQTMLGARDGPGRSDGVSQLSWFQERIATNGTTWLAWANEVLTMPLRAGGSTAGVPINHDAWDGYQYERRQIAEAIRAARAAEGGVDNVVTLTGDMHSYVAGYQQVQYGVGTGDASPSTVGPGANRVGVEFMTPAVTSVNLAELLPGPDSERQSRVVEALVRANNPHVEFFNSSQWGYSIVEFTPDACTYRAHAVDKTENAPSAGRELVTALWVPEGRVEIREAEETPDL